MEKFINIIKLITLIGVLIVLLLDVFKIVVLQNHLQFITFVLVYVMFLGSSVKKQ
jgi:hypothetical protein